MKKNAPTILRSGFVVSAMTMVSRFLGLARDVVFAAFLGPGGAMDAFFVAFKVPNFLRRLFAEGAFAQAFVPVLSEYRAKGSQAAVQHFIDRVAGCLGLSLIALTVIVVLASPLFAAIFGAGFLVNAPEKFALTADLLRWTFPYLMLVSLTGFAGAILNSYDRFAVPAFTPVLLNIVLILSAVLVSPMLSEPVYALAWGVLCAGVIQLLFQLPFLLRLGLLPHPKVDWSDEAVVKVLKLMAPAMFGVSVSQINLMFDTVLASFLPNGSVSWLYFSDRLTELPLGVFAVGISTVILPVLSRQFALGKAQFNHTLDWSLRMIILIALPAMLALIVIAEPLLFALFQYNKTEPRDIYMASVSLRAYALGLTAFMLIKVLASAYFARQDTRTPVKVGIIAMISNMGLNIVFVLPFHYLWQIGHAGLALATSVSAWINAGLLYRGLRKGCLLSAHSPQESSKQDHSKQEDSKQQDLKQHDLKQTCIYQPVGAWRVFFLRVIFANVLMMFALLGMRYVFGAFADQDWLWRCVAIVVFTFVGFAAYLVGLFLTGLRLSHLRAPEQH